MSDFAVVLVSVFAGLVPMLIYPIFLYFMDRYEKEPPGLLIAGFAWGFVPAAIFSLITQVVLDVPLFLLDETGLLSDVVGASVIAPVTEEFFKGMAVWLIYIIWKHEFDGVFDGIVYGSLVGFGFAAIENILYFISFGADPGLILLRSVVFGLNHAFYTSLTGASFGVARHTRNSLLRMILPVLGMMAAIAAHSLHNLSVTFAGEYPGLFLLAVVADYSGIIFIFIIMIFATRRERRWIIEQLEEEVALHTLSQAQYHVAHSPLRRLGIRLNALGRRGLKGWISAGRYFVTLTDLAYKKHAFDRRGEASSNQNVINSLRTQAAGLSEEMAELF